MHIHEPFLIVGMHRSGTSCLAGSLEMAGLYLGDVNTYAAFNKKGNRENRAIMDYHDGILARTGTSWDNPPVSDPEWNQADKDGLKELISSYAGIKKWGVKDPRMLFMVEGWRAVTAPKLIGSFRHPNEVAASLVHRAEVWKQPMEMDVAYELWAAYNEKLISIYSETPFDIIRYDIEPRIYNRKLITIAQKLGLNSDTINGFREEGLHNQHKRDEATPAYLKDIWEALNDIAI